MANKKRKLTFTTLNGRAQAIASRLTNAIALHSEDCCMVDDIAEEFGTTPGRLRTTLLRLEEAGLIEITGDVSQLVVPTTKLLRHQDPNLTEAQAADLIRQYKRAQYD